MKNKLASALLIALIATPLHAFSKSEIKEVPSNNNQVASFKISQKGLISWKEKIVCSDIMGCMKDLKAAKNMGKKASLAVGKKKKYISISHKYPCTNACFDDVKAFILSKSILED